MRVLTVTTESGDDLCVDDLAFSPDGRRLAAAVRNRGVFLADLSDGAFHPFPSYPRPCLPRALLFHPAGRLSWVDFHRRFEYGPAGYEPDPLRGTRRHQVHDQGMSGPDGRLVAVTTNPAARRYGRALGRPLVRSGARLRCWRPTTGGWAEEWAVERREVEVGHWMAAAAGRFFTTEWPAGDPGNGELVCRWAADGAEVARVTNPIDRDGTAPTAAPDGSLAAYCDTLTITVWRPGEAPRMVVEARGLLNGPAFHPSGAYLAVTHYFRSVSSVRLYDLGSGRLIRQYDWGLGVMGVAFSPDGSLGAAGTADGRVVLWDCD